MTDVSLPDSDLDAAQHRAVAASCFNHTWTLMGIQDRSPEQDRLMLEVAEASRFHWRFAGGPLQVARGSWLLSRVLVVLGRGEEALQEAEHSLELVRVHDLGAFDEAFAHEAIARARIRLGDTAGAASARADGESIAVLVETDSEREWVRRNLASISGDPPA